jgi:hypothetical protein
VTSGAAGDLKSGPAAHPESIKADSQASLLISGKPMTMGLFVIANSLMKNASFSF